MNHEDIAKMFADAYENVMSKRDSKDYEVNPIQWKRLIDLVQFLYETAEYDGKVLPVNLVPKEIVGGVTAEFTLFYIHGNEVLKFCEVLKHASAVSVDATTDGQVVISATIPNVFRKKSR